MFEILPSEDVKTEGGVLIVAFPSVGMVGTIAGNYIADALSMDRAAYILSDDLPPAALIQDGVPVYPLRIMSKGKVSVLSSEFQLPLALAGPLTRAVMDWTNENGFHLIVCLEGLMSDKSTNTGEPVRVFGVGSTEHARSTVDAAEIQRFKTGVVTGISGALLSEGERTSRDVVCLLTDANAMYPDARGAAKLVQSVSVMLPTIDVDVKELMEEAERIEENVKSTVDRTKDMLAARQSQAERLGKSYMYG